MIDWPNLREFDPADAHVVARRRVRARKVHRCDRSRVGSLHFIRAGERHQVVTLVDRAHATFARYRSCDWCEAGAPRDEAHDGIPGIDNND